MEENIFSDFIDLFTSCGILHASEKGKGAVNKIENDMQKDSELKKDVDALIKDIRSI